MQKKNSIQFIKNNVTKCFIVSLFIFSNLKVIAQAEDVLVIHNMFGNFSCVQNSAGANGNFYFCSLPAVGDYTSPPGCMSNLCNYDIIMVQGTYSSFDTAFMAELIAYLQCGGKLYFQNDITPGSSPNGVPSPGPSIQNINDLLAAIGQPAINVSYLFDTHNNTPSTINLGNSGFHECSLTPPGNLSFSSGGLMYGPALANAATVSIGAGTTSAFWQTPFGGVLGFGSEYYSSGNVSNLHCNPGSGPGAIIWSFMSDNPNCLNANFSMSDAITCVGNTLEFTDQTSGGGEVTDWDWIFESGMPSTSNLENPGLITYSNPGTFDVMLKVTTEDGEIDSITMQITVIECTPIASFSVIDTICIGEPFLVTDLSTCNLPLTSWDWNLQGANPSSSVLQDPGGIVYSTVGTYNITLTVGVGQVMDDTTLTLVVVDCAPYASFSMVDTVCMGEPFNIIDLSSSDLPILSWNWDFTGANPSNSAVQDPENIVYNLPGTYSVTLTVGNSEKIDDTTLTIVVVDCVPVASFSVVDTVCIGESFNVADLSISDLQLLTWNWDLSGSNLGNSMVQDPGDIIYTLTGTYSITLTVGNGEEVDDTTIAIVAIDCVPHPSFFVMDTVCIGEPFNVTDLSYSDLPFLSWNWDFTGANPSSSLNQDPGNIIYDTPGIYNITLTIGNSEQMKDTTITIVAVDCVPVASFSAVDTVCIGAPFEITNLSTSDLTILSWNWEITGANPSSSSAQYPGEIIYEVPGTYMITLTVENSEQIDDTTLTIIAINCIPHASFSISNDTICEGECINVFEMSTSPIPILNHSWMFPGGDTGVSDFQQPGLICYESSGLYPITLAVGNLNSTDDTTIFIFVAPNPIASFSNSPVQPFTDQNMNLYNNSIGAIEWEWNINDLISDDFNPNVIFSENGTHEILLWVASDFGCVDSVTNLINVVDDLIYYVPNSFTPDGDEFNNVFKPIFHSGFDSNDYELLIFNRWGEVVFESHDSSIGWDGTDFLGREKSPDGTYSWIIKVKYITHDERLVINGHVNLLR